MQTTDDNATTGVAHAPAEPPLPAPAPQPGVAWAPIIGGIMVVLVAMFWFFGKERVQAWIAPKFVVIDTARLLKAGTNTVMAAPNMTPEEAVRLGDKFSVQLRETIKRYTDAGYVVLVKQAVLGTPEGWDITEPLAVNMGIDLKRAGN